MAGMCNKKIAGSLLEKVFFYPVKPISASSLFTLFPLFVEAKKTCFGLVDDTTNLETGRSDP